MPGAAFTSMMPPPLSGRGWRDVRGDQVDAAHVEADDAGRPLAQAGGCPGGPRRSRRGRCRRWTGSPFAQEKSRPPAGTSSGIGRTGQEVVTASSTHDPGQRLLVALAAERVLVLDGDQLRPRWVPSPTTRAGIRSARGHHLAVDDEDAVVVAGEVLLDDARRGETGRRGRTPRRPPPPFEAEGDGLPLVAVERLDRQRRAERSKRGDRLVGCGRCSPRGTGMNAVSSSRLVSALSQATSTAMTAGPVGLRGWISRRRWRRSRAARGCPR